MRGAEEAAFWFFLGGWVAALLRACALALATALCFFSRRSSIVVGGRVAAGAADALVVL